MTFEEWWEREWPIGNRDDFSRCWNAAVQSTKSHSPDVEEYYRPRYGCHYADGPPKEEEFCWLGGTWSRCECAEVLGEKGKSKEDCPFWREI